MNDLRLVPFDEAGEGVVLYFRNADARTLLNAYGKAYQEVVYTSLLGFDLEVMDKLLHVSAKQDGKPFKVSMDDLDNISMDKVQEKLLNAFSLCMNGRTYLENMAYLEEEMRKRVAEGRQDEPPPITPQASSESSARRPSGQESLL